MSTSMPRPVRTSWPTCRAGCRSPTRAPTRSSPRTSWRSSSPTRCCASSPSAGACPRPGGTRFADADAGPSALHAHVPRRREAAHALLEQRGPACHCRNATAGDVVNLGMKLAGRWQPTMRRRSSAHRREGGARHRDRARFNESRHPALRGIRHAQQAPDEADRHVHLECTPRARRVNIPFRCRTEPVTGAPPITCSRSPRPIRRAARACRPTSSRSRAWAAIRCR